MRVKCLAQEHNTMSPARARTRTARSEVERTNHEATAPPYLVCRGVIEDVLLCSECGEEVETASVSEHCIKSHQGQQCSTVQEFD